MTQKDPDWLGDLSWQGYPRLEPVHDLGPIKVASAPKAPLDPRASELVQENKALRARVDEFARLAAEFERRLSEAGAAYEGAIMHAETNLRDAQLECKGLASELKSARADCAHLTARDSSREADLRLERERRADLEKALAQALRRVEELTSESERLRAEAAEKTGTLEQLRRQAKTPTDEDVLRLRQEMRDCLAKFRRINDTLGEKQ